MSIVVDSRLRGTVFKNATIYTPDKVISKGALVVEGERIGFIGPISDLSVPQGARIVDVEGKKLCPGFIDIHTHGALGFDFTDAGKEGIEKILYYHARFGTTSLLATTISASHEKLLSACETLGQMVNVSGRGSEILGIHLEGPYLNPENRGCHNADVIRDPSVEEFHSYRERSKKTVKLITLAPEQPGAERLIAECERSQVISAVAHSTAGYDIIRKAKSLGLRHAAHFFNCYPFFHHRKSGMIGTILDDVDFTVELIADKIHLLPITITLVYRLKGADKIILITDASPFSGLEPDQEITDAHGTLAGSNLTMIKAVQNMVYITGCPLSEAIQMATLNPAKLLGVEHRKGSLEVGKDADLVLFDDDFHVESVYCRGKPL